MTIRETIEVSVQTDLDQSINRSKVLREQLEAAARVRINTMAAPARATQAPDNIANTYDQARAGVGTGAAGRDFAKQSQGLGGLVRLYATFAANIFAASAAFNALSSAMDTSNIVKGLDQLGAASGRSLGGLAKQMVAAADGAISLRDAMSSTALASSAGMNNTNIIRMTEVAKKASLALGRDMADSMDRLTKGIAKTQPELLDELGIMARVIPAQEKYARQIGKTVSSLTDLEKKQAFANAVLEEGEKKFNEINIDSNAYSKLAASMSNAMQKGLELVNMVLAPIAKFLALNPTALVTAIGAIGIALLRQAVPAFGEFQKGLEATADRAKSIAVQRSADADKARKANFDKLKQSLDDEAEIKLAKLEASEAAAKKLAAAASFKPSKSVQAILNKDVRDVTETDLTKIDKLAAAQAKQGRDALAQSYRDLAIAIRESQAAEAKFDKEVAAGTKRLEEKESAMTAAGRARILADRAIQSATNSGIIKQAGETASISGFSAAWKEASEAVAASKPKIESANPVVKALKTGLVNVSAGLTMFRAGIAALTSTISSILAVAAPWLELLGLIITAVTILAPLLSKNAKEAEATSQAFTALEDATKGAVNTFERLQKLDPLERLSANNLMAKSTALSELGDSTEKLFTKITAQIQAENGFDSFFDAVKAKVGLGLIKESSTALAEAATSASKLAKGTEAGAVFTKQITEALGVDPSDEKALKSALNTTQEKFLELAPKVIEALKNVGAATTKTSSAAQAFSSALTTTGKAFDDLLISQLPTDLVAKLGYEFITLGKTIPDALAEPEAAIARLVEIASDSQKLKLFSPDFALEIAKVSPQIELLGKQVVNYKQTIKDIDEKIAQLNKEKSGMSLNNEGDATGIVNIDKQLRALEQGKQNLNSVIGGLQTQLDPFIAKFAQEEIKAFARGAELVINSIADGFAKATNILAKAFAQGLGDTEAGIRERARLEKQSIDIQIRQIDTAMSLANSQDQLRLITEERLLFDRRKDLETVDTSGKQKGTPEQFKRLGEQEQGLAAAQQYFGKINLKGVSALLQQGAGSAANEAGKILLESVTRNEGNRAQKAQLGAQKGAIDFGVKQQVLENRAKVEKDILEVAVKKLETEKQTVDSQVKAALYLDMELLNRKQTVEESIALNKAAQDELTLRVELNKAQDAFLAAKKAGTGVAAAEKAIEEIQQKRARDSEKKAEEAAQRQTGYIQERTGAQKAQSDYEFAKLKEIEATRAASAQADLAIQDEKISRLKTTGAIIDQDIVRLTTQADKNKEIERSQAAQNALVISYAEKIKGLEGQKAQQVPGSTAAQNIQTEIDQQRTQAEQAIANEQRVTAEKLKTLDVQGKINESQAKFAELAQRSADLTQSLTTVFGDLGAAIGTSVEALVKSAETQEKYDIARQELLKTYSEDSQQVKDLDSKNNRDQLKGIGQIASAAKKMFGEKTAAAKLFGAIEKANAVMSMALQAQQLAQFIATTATQLTTSIPAIYATAMKQLGPIAGPIAAAAAIATFIGAAAGGGGGGSSYTGPSSEDQQKVQGTGMQYQGDKLVNTGRGVLGAEDQLSNTLTKSLELLADNSIKNLTVDRSMLKAITELTASIMQIVTSVAQQAGLTTGMNFGTLPGVSTISKGGLFGSGILGGVFGGGTTKNSTITGAGLSFTGSISQLADQAANSLMQYKDILTKFHKDGGWFSSDKDWTTMTTELQKASTAVQTAVGGFFTNIEKTAYATAKKAGISVAEVQKVLATTSVTQKLDLKGLSIEDQNKLLESVASNALSAVFMKLTPELKKFQQAGEDFAATVFRLYDAQEKVNLSIDSILGKFTSKLSVEFTQSLIEAAGGLKTFIDQAEFFSEKFLSESTRVKLSSQQISSKLSTIKKDTTNVELKNSGLKDLSATSSREAFSDVIQYFAKNITKGTNAAKYQSLIELAPQFDYVVSAAEKAAEQLNNLNINLLTAQGKTYDAKEAQRTAALAKIEDSSQKTLQQDIYDAEDLAKTRSLNIELLTAEGKSYKALQKTRQDELKALSDSDQLIKQKTYDAQDEQKTEALNIQLLNLQGKATEALKLTRDREKAAVSASDKAILLEIYTLQDAAAALQKLNAVRSLEAEIYQLLGNSSKALELQREAELSTTDESLKTLKKYKFALQDEATLKDKITAAYNKQKEALKSTVSSLEGSIATLRDLKTSALSSSLTPQQLYQNRKNEFLTLSAAASATITDTSTEAEKTARDTALNKLPQAATDFLESSKVLNASSAQFTADQGLVSSYIDAATTALESQKSTAQQQIDLLDDSVSALNIIETNTETTASLLSQLVTLQTATAAARTAVTSDSSLVGSTITAHAAGGIASGISLVGELGPEIVDFKTPGRVYSNSASNDLFNTKELVQEIRSLRQEVKQLRDDQQQQTGHLITATYDASAQNAEEVTAGAETALNTQSWKTRSQIKLA